MASSYIPLEDSDPNRNRFGFRDKASNHAQIFGIKKQTLLLIFKTYVRCLVTTIFIAFVLATLKIYQNRNSFSSDQKTNFNVIITALSLCLGLNFFDSFKDLANVLRWKILSRYKHKARRDLILAIESLISVAQLGWESRSIPGLFIFCITWIFLNLLAQTSVALINLTYDLNDGTNSNGTYTRNGIVNAPNLRCYFNTLKTCPIHIEVPQGLAHAYGRTPYISSRGSYDQIQDIEKSKDYNGYFCRTTPGECAYRFVEYNPNDTQRNYPFLTDRVITASTGQCYTYWETEKVTPAKDTSGVMDAWKFKISNGSVHDTIIIPQQNGGLDATTYIYRGYHAPPQAKAKNVRCGRRCIWMWAHKNPGDGENSTFYQCPITISNVYSTNGHPTGPTQVVPDEVAYYAASSIALQGRLVVNPHTKENIWTQFQFFPFRDEWDLHSKNGEVVDATKAGAKMAEFAIRSLSTMAFKNPTIRVQGLVPYLGTSIEVKWKYAIALCACIVAVQLMLSILVYVLYVDPTERDSEG